MSLESVKSTRWKTMQVFNMKNSKYINPKQEIIIQVEKWEKKTWRYSRSQGKLLLGKKKKSCFFCCRFYLCFWFGLAFLEDHTRHVVGKQILCSLANLWVVCPLTYVADFCSWEDAAKWKFFHCSWFLLWNENHPDLY